MLLQVGMTVALVISNFAFLVTVGPVRSLPQSWRMDFCWVARLVIQQISALLTGVPKLEQQLSTSRKVVYGS